MTVADGSAVPNTIDANPTVRQRRRRWPRVTVITGLALVVLFVAATAGIGYYFSGVLLDVDNSVSYPVEVKAVNGAQVTLSRDPDTERPVVEGLWWNGGAAVLSSSATASGDSVVRTVTSTLHGSLTAGLRAALDPRTYDGDPKTDRGLPFEQVMVNGQVGAMPAWYVPRPPRRRARPGSSPSTGARAP